MQATFIYEWVNANLVYVLYDFMNICAKIQKSTLVKKSQQIWQKVKLDESFTKAWDQCQNMKSMKNKSNMKSLIDIWKSQPRMLKSTKMFKSTFCMKGPPTWNQWQIWKPNQT